MAEWRWRLDKGPNRLQAYTRVLRKASCSQYPLPLKLFRGCPQDIPQVYQVAQLHAPHLVLDPCRNVNDAL